MYNLVGDDLIGGPQMVLNHVLAAALAMVRAVPRFIRRQFVFPERRAAAACMSVGMPVALVFGGQRPAGNAHSLLAIYRGHAVYMLLGGACAILMTFVVVWTVAHVWGCLNKVGGDDPPYQVAILALSMTGFLMAAVQIDLAVRSMSSVPPVSDVNFMMTAVGNLARLQMIAMLAVILFGGLAALPGRARPNFWRRNGLSLLSLAVLPAVLVPALRQPAFLAWATLAVWDLSSRVNRLPRGPIIAARR